MLEGLPAPEGSRSARPATYSQVAATSGAEGSWPLVGFPD